jgi:hypothetical protein
MQGGRAALAAGGGFEGENLRPSYSSLVNEPRARQFQGCSGHHRSRWAKANITMAVLCGRQGRVQGRVLTRQRLAAAQEGLWGLFMQRPSS